MRQLSFNLGSNHRGSSVIQSSGYPFLDVESFSSVVSQNGDIKVYGICDETKEHVVHEFLVVGTGDSISVDIDKIVFLGTVLLSDSKYGYSIYYIRGEDADEGIEQEDSKSGIYMSISKFFKGKN